MKVPGTMQTCQVVLPYLVVLQVPALDLLVFSGREQVWMPGADGKTPHSTDVSSQCELETTTGKFPKLLGKGYPHQTGKAILIGSIFWSFCTLTTKITITPYYQDDIPVVITSH